MFNYLALLPFSFVYQPIITNQFSISMNFIVIKVTLKVITILKINCSLKIHIRNKQCCATRDLILFHVSALSCGA